MKLQTDKGEKEAQDMSGDSGQEPADKHEASFVLSSGINVWSWAQLLSMSVRWPTLINPTGKRKAVEITKCQYLRKWSQPKTDSDKSTATVQP